MFLTENYYVENTEVSADPIYAMQIMQEATEDWNDICMKMIKLEHTAIMRNDVALLEAGGKEAIVRFKNNVMIIGKKIIEFLERVRVQWSKLQATIATKFLNVTAIENMKKSLGDKAGNFEKNGKKTMITLPKDWTDMKAIVSDMSSCTTAIATTVLNAVKVNGTDTVAEYSKEGNKDGKFYKVANELNKHKGRALTNSDDGLNEKIDNIISKYNFETVEADVDPVQLTWAIVGDAITFLKQRPVAIKNIETMKKAVTQIQNAKLRDLDTDAEKKPQMRNELVNLQRAFNKLIIKINKMTSTAVKICNTAKDTSKSNLTSAQKSQAYKDAKNKGLIHTEKIQNESVLDLF